MKNKSPFSQELELKFQDGTTVTVPKKDYEELDELCKPHRLKYRVCMVCGPEKIKELQR